MVEIQCVIGYMTERFLFIVKMRFFVYFFVAICALPFYDAANILGVFPLPGKSHFVMFERLMKRLAEKGHNVDVATHFPSKEVPEG